MLSMRMIFSIIGAAVGIIIGIMVFGQIATAVECPGSIGYTNSLGEVITENNHNKRKVLTPGTHTNISTGVVTQLGPADFIRGDYAYSAPLAGKTPTTDPAGYCATASGAKYCVAIVTPYNMDNPQYNHCLLYTSPSPRDS